ncbi:MAG: hypothetical protein JNG88_14745 [Phycisphaerales bacterium]|nr:hypothetical protein [Phycisphaerales bacterium]
MPRSRWMVLASLALSLRVQAGDQFADGYVYISEAGTEGCLMDLCWVRAINPATGENWIFADSQDGLCWNVGLGFTPDGSRLRVLNWGRNQILDFDIAGNGVVAFDGSDGINMPYGGNGLAWDNAGNFCVANEGGANELLRFLASGGPPEVLADGIYAGGIAIGPDGAVYVAGYYLVRIVADGTVEVVDPYFGDVPAARSVAFDRDGNLYVACDHRFVPPGGGIIFRYQGTDFTTREVFQDGLNVRGGDLSITFSANYQTLYVTDQRRVYAVNVADGTRTTIYFGPYDPEGDYIHYVGFGIAVYKAPKPGDMNCDNWVNNFDIDPFVLALTDEAGYAARFGWCDRTRADVNRDGTIDNFDIDAFVEAVIADRAE